jgi:hypothetical protein
MFKKNITIVLSFFLICFTSQLIAQAYDGLTLVNTMNSRTARLITNDGQTVNSWYCTAGVAYVPYLMPDSTMWRPATYSGATMRGAAYGGLIEHYSWDGNVIQSFLWSNQYHQQHHDIHPISNGNVLLVSWDRKTRTEAQAMGRQNITGDMWPDEVIEYDPIGDSVVWEWHFWDHLIQDVDSTKPNYGVVAEHPELLDINVGSVQQGDWMHCNTVDYNEERDEILLTSHNLHEIYVIDHGTTTEEARGHTGGRHGKGGDILYRWGNPQNYERGTSTDREFYVVHGANWIRSGMLGAGNIIVLNNGDRSGSSNDYSVIEEITPPLDSVDNYYIAPDSAFGPMTLTWSYSNPGSFYAQHLGGAYRLPNGNTLAILGSVSRLVEVTYTGQVVWEYNVGGQIGRALKYPRDFTSSNEENIESQPQVYRLNPNSPNPFVNSTSIKYNLSIMSSVKITVHNISGRLINVLVEDIKETGTHEAVFSPGSTLPTGVYFMRFEISPLDNSTNERYVAIQKLVKE